MKTSSKLFCLDIAGRIAGLVWSISGLFSIIFFIAAFVEPAEWPRFFSLLTVALGADWLVDGLRRIDKRIALEADMAPERAPPADADERCFDAMHAGRQAFVERAAAVGLNPAAWARSTITVVRDRGNDKARAMERACSPPTDFLFSNACRAFNDVDRAEVVRMAEALRQKFSTVLVNHGVERVELERRRFILLLQANYESELDGDFSKSTAKARAIVVTLMAAGLTLERLIEVPWERDIFAHVLAEADPEEDRERIWA